MPAIDLQGIRSFVRLSLDTDEDELPDSLIDMYVSEGYNRAIGTSDEWNFFAVEYTFDTVANQQAYDFGSATPVTGINLPLQSIEDVRGETWSLTPVAHDQIRAAMRMTQPTSSRPWGWSEHGTSLYLWPIPAAVYSIAVSGYRKPNDWISVGSGSTPDCPYDFNEALTFHALSRGWAQQTDPDMAKYYDELFDDQIRRLKTRYTTPAGSGPYVQNGGLGVGAATRNGLGPLIYPFA